MKPANFPERVRQRQIRAEARLAAAMGRKPLIRQLEEADALALKIAEGNQRDKRTKKDRRDRARFRPS